MSDFEDKFKQKRNEASGKVVPMPKPKIVPPSELEAPSEKEAKQSDLLIRLAGAASLFRTADDTAYADIQIAGHRETWPIRSRQFSRWMGYEFYKKTGRAPGSEALQTALNIIEARADFDADERTVHVRIGGADGAIYVDLADAAWRAIEVTSAGWTIVDEPPVRFRRAAGMKSLPEPTRGGNIGNPARLNGRGFFFL